MIRARLLLLTLVFTLAGPRRAAGQATTLTAADDRAVRGVTADYAVATKDRAWDRVLSYLAPTAVLLPPHEPAVQQEGLRTWLEKSPSFTQFDTPIDRIEGAGDLAALRGTYSITFTLPGQTVPIHDRGKWASIMRKQGDGTWRIVSEIWNSDLPLPR